MQTLTSAARRKAGRRERLMQHILFDRAALYARLGRCAQARREREKLFAHAPDFPGQRDKLGLAPASPVPARA